LAIKPTLRQNIIAEFYAKAAAPASATTWSSSTVLPETPIAPTILPSAFFSGTPPGKEIKPPLETSRFARLRKFADVAGRHIKKPRRFRFFDGNVNASQPSVVHSDKSLQIRARVNHCDIHFDIEFFGFFISRFYDCV
jgi:hypothetical protein